MMRSVMLSLAVFALPTGCQTAPQAASSVPTHQPAQASTNSRSVAGDFLAARQAFYLNDVAASASFYLSALEQDERNSNLLQQSFLSQYRNGDIDLAAALARQLESINVKVPYGAEPAIAQAIKSADWDAVMVLADRLAEDITATPQAGVIKAWALVAAGRGDAGLSGLRDTGRVLASAEGASPAYIELQLALMSEFLGYKDEAIAHATALAMKEGLPAKMALQTAGILARNDDTATAETLLDQLPYSFEKRKVTVDKLLRPETIAAYIADAIIDTALAYREPPFQEMLLARLQLVTYLDPENDPGRFFLAQSWVGLQDFDRAKANLAAIDDTSLWAQPRLLLHSDIETKLDNLGAAIDLINAHLANYPDNGYLQKECGDLYRRNEQFKKARDAYLLALETGFDTADLYRNLGIAYEQLEQDDDAEANFRAALQRNPNDPFTLNYLGYWWAEAGRNLDEAIQLIEHAVKLRPTSGFFVDSLGWVHYQLGNFDLAVEFLEKATMLESADALIVSHLGDAYWQTKRYNEARFKWHYALSLTTDADLKNSLQQKLTFGLAATGR